MQKLLKIQDLTNLNLGSTTTIWRKVNKGEFPKPIKLGSAHSSPVRWKEETITDYLNNLNNA